MTGEKTATCECHGVLMTWNTDNRPGRHGFWRCTVKYRADERERYAKWSGVRYNRKLLINRRNKALVRQRRRHEALA